MDKTRINNSQDSSTVSMMGTAHIHSFIWLQMEYLLGMDLWFQLLQFRIYVHDIQLDQDPHNTNFEQASYPYMLNASVIESAGV